jgi:hypothetical protein
MSTDTFEGTSPHINDVYINRQIAGEALTMGQVVEITTDQTVKKPTVNPSLKRCGICMTSAAINKSVSVLWRGRVRVTAYGTLTAGDNVVSGPGGTVQTQAAATAADCTTSAGTALSINQNRVRMGSCDIGAASGGSAIILMGI